MNRAKKLIAASIAFCVACMLSVALQAQCPELPNADAIDHTVMHCVGDQINFITDGVNLAIGSTVDWYLVDGTENPYMGNGVLIGSADVTGDPCVNAPEIMYVMVNPDNGQVGGSGDQCDEFIVMWTGSGGFLTSDIIVSNLGPGTFMWDGYTAGNAASFSCGTPLPPGPVPPNAILIIQSSPNTNFQVDSDVLCASGLPVYIIAYDGTSACTGGYFDNNSPCSSCPFDIDINGADCQFSFQSTYNPPGSSLDGWAWGNTGSGIFGDEIPVLDIPVFDMGGIEVEDFLWTIPSDFCDNTFEMGPLVVGIPNPPPGPGCIQITTPYFGIGVACSSISLTGGGEVCQGNCPDNPTIISFDIESNDLPLVANLIVSIPIFGQFPIDDLELTLGYTIQVCLGGLLPSFDPATGILTVPDLAVGFSTMVEIASITSAQGCEVEINQNSVALQFIEAPFGNAGSDQTICSDEIVSLSGTSGGSASDFLWTSDGDGIFINPNSLTADYVPGPTDIANGSVILTLTLMDQNGSCTPFESTVEITIVQSIEVAVNAPNTICNTSFADIEAIVTGGPADGEWVSSGDGDFDDPEDPLTSYYPGLLDIQNSSVTLQFIPSAGGNCVGNVESVVIDIVNAPEVDIPTSVEICVGDTAYFSVSVTGDFVYANIDWNNNPGMTEVNGFDITYIPTQMEMDDQYAEFSFVVPSIYAECGIALYTIPIFMTDCDCPPIDIAGMPDAICYDADTLDLDALIIDAPSGSWSLVNTPPGINPAVLLNDQLISDFSDHGIYQLQYNVNFPEPGCPSFEEIDITLVPYFTPDLGQDKIACADQQVIINAIYQIAVPTQYSWSSSGDGSFINSSALGATYVPGPTDQGTDVEIYLSIANAPCADQNDTVVISFVDPPVVTFIGDTITLCNGSGLGSIVDFYSLIMTGDLTGTWANTDGAPVDFTNPSAVDFNGAPEGFFVFSYTTNSAMPPCMDATYQIVLSIEDCACPFIITQNVPEGVCNDLAQLPMNAFIMAGAPGSWQVISAPPGMNPATFMDDNLQINGADPGEYLLRFTFDAAPLIGCPDSAELIVYLQEVPTIDLPVDTAICNDQVLQLTGTIGGSTVDVLWVSAGSGSFDMNPAMTTNYTFSAADIANHQVLLYGTSVDTSGFCQPATDSIIVNIVHKAFIQFSTTDVSICNNPDSGSVVNFTSIILDGDINPDWLDADNSGAVRVGGNLFDFDGVPAGQYTFIATTNNSNPPCGQESYQLTITVRDCLCPALEILTTPLAFCAGESFDLAGIIIEAAAGTWLISNAPVGSTAPVIAGQMLTTINSTAGVYTLTYMLDDMVAGCEFAVDIPLTIETTPIINVTNLQCDPDKLNYTVNIQTDGVNLIADAGTMTMTGPGAYMISGIDVNHNVSISLTSATGLCNRSIVINAPDCECTLFTEDIADTISFCPGDTFVLIPFITGAQGFALSTWVTPGGTFMKPTLPVFEAGQYIWIVIDTALCENRDTFYAVFIGPESFVSSSVPPSCPQSDDGQIIIASVAQGTPPFSISLDGGSSMVINQFPFVINNVSAGMHQLTLRDGNGCELMATKQVPPPGVGSVSLGPDVTLIKGDSILIQVATDNIEPVTFDWNIPQGTLDGSSFYYTPLLTTTVTVEVMDTAGCIYTDQLLINVIEETLFYFPNVFSPNFDQVNDRWEMITNLPDERIVSLEIFDRWGSQLYRQQGASPFVWDGTAHGKPVNPGVFVFKLLYEDEDGNLLSATGDITVIR